MSENQGNTAKIEADNFLDVLWFQVEVDFFQSEKTSVRAGQAGSVP